MNSVSPLRYPGGKACLYTLMKGIINGNKMQLSQYCEPFAGGCGLALSLLFGGDVSDIHINDIDPSIWAFWEAVLHHTDEFIRLIDSTPITVDEWLRQRAIHEKCESSEIVTLGFAAFFLNRTSRSGIIRGSGVIGGKDQKGTYKIDCRFNRDELIRRIRRIAMYKEQIHLSKMDALDFMQVKSMTLPQNTLFCIDPPYFEQGSKLYTNSFTKEDHERVAQAVQRLKHSYVVTYDNAEYIASLFESQRRYLLKLPYSLQIKRTGTELVIVSEKLKVRMGELGKSNVDLTEYISAGLDLIASS